MAHSAAERVDREQGQLAGGLTGVGVLAGPERAESDDLGSSQRHIEPVYAVRRRPAQRLAPGPGEGLRVEGGRDLGRQPVGIGVDEDLGLDVPDGRGIADARPAHTGIGCRPSFVAHCVLVVVVVVVVVVGLVVVLVLVVVAVARVVLVVRSVSGCHQTPENLGARRSRKAARPSRRSALAHAAAKAP